MWSSYGLNDRRTRLRRCFKEDFKAANKIVLGNVDLLYVFLSIMQKYLKQELLIFPSTMAKAYLSGSTILRLIKPLNVKISLLKIAGK